MPSSGPFFRLRPFGLALRAGHLLPKGESPSPKGRRTTGGIVPLPLGEGAAKRRVRARYVTVFTPKFGAYHGRFPPSQSDSRPRTARTLVPGISAYNLDECRSVLSAGRWCGPTKTACRR